MRHGESRYFPVSHVTTKNKDSLKITHQPQFSILFACLFAPEKFLVANLSQHNSCWPVSSSKVFAGQFGPAYSLLTSSGSHSICWPVWASKVYAGQFGLAKCFASGVRGRPCLYFFKFMLVLCRATFWVRHFSEIYVKCKVFKRLIFGKGLREEMFVHSF